MAQRSHVPKFGNWEGEENVPYTAYFDKARKGRTGPGGKMINPNDPQENQDMLSDISSSASSPPKVRAEPEGPIYERRRSREDNDLKQFSNSPAHRENLGRKTSGETGYQPNRGRGVSSGETHRKPVPRHSAGSENSVERSPLHRHAKVSGRDSPSWEGKPSYDSGHGTPGRSRLKPRDESPEKGAAVPKFGEWDENDPTSADGFTHIFNKVREEKAGKVPGTPSQPSYDARRQASNDSAKSCCFPWSRK